MASRRLVLLQKKIKASISWVPYNIKNVFLKMLSGGFWGVTFAEDRDGRTTIYCLSSAESQQRHTGFPQVYSVASSSPFTWVSCFASLQEFPTCTCVYCQEQRSTLTKITKNRLEITATYSPFVSQQEAMMQ